MRRFSAGFITAFHLAVFFCIIIIPISSMFAKTRSLQPLAPENGSVLTTNIPTLVWSLIKADSFFVEVDGRLMDRLPGDRNRTGIFPLSFGRHAWRVIAVQNKKHIKSPPSHFTIEDQPAGDVPPGAIHLRDGWQIQSSVFAGNDGKKISSGQTDAEGWYSSSVPVTVLSVLVRNGVYPNPYIGKNNLRIPDLSDAFNKKQNLLRFSHIFGQNPWKNKYWYRKAFRIPESFHYKQIILQLTEINYKAEVWLNGKLVADTSTIVGMERRFRFNVTDQINLKQQNILAVAVYPPDHPGEPSPPPLKFTDHPGRNLGADGGITLDYTKWDALGWDWQPAIRDRDMGIPDEVFLIATGPVEIRDPYIAAQLLLPDTSFAYLLSEVTLINHSNQTQTGLLKLNMKAVGHDDAPIHFSIPVVLQPGEMKEFRLTPNEIEALKLDHPRLWWPVGWGRPDRYRFMMTFQIDDQVSHQVSDVFGIRNIQTFMGNNERVYRINGHDCYMKGGNWVIDMMLNWTASRYIQEMRLSALCHMNIQRVWGPTGVPPRILFRAADSLGIMIWQDFLNDFWGSWKNDPKFKPPKDLFSACSADIVKKLRNHPCLMLWCGGNEGPNQYESLIMHNILPEYDPWGGRSYLRISNSDGLHGGGPYHTIRPVEYFEHERLSGFSSEIGPSGVPVLSSLYKFLPELGKTWAEDKFPLYGDWGYHDANERGQWDPRKFSHYDNILRQDYGTPAEKGASGVADYANKAQLVNYDVYRAVVEALNQDLWKASSGFALWKFNASWPSLTWQLFDWYLAANSGFYAVQNACESMHVQWNRDSGSISIVNTSLKDRPGILLRASIWDQESRKMWQNKEQYHLPANTAIETEWHLPESRELEFVRLTLSDSTGFVLSNNTYWRHPENDFTGLMSLPVADINVRSRMEKNPSKTAVHVDIENPGSRIAFFIHLNIVGNRSREAVVPLYCSENYITLLPGESRYVTIKYTNSDLTEKPLLVWEGVNVEKSKTALD
ncbi:hypothetical protein JW835_15295 [bacterium]|nr:hypothetical protein [bacterium]